MRNLRRKCGEEQETKLSPGPHLLALFFFLPRPSPAMLMASRPLDTDGHKCSSLVQTSPLSSQPSVTSACLSQRLLPLPAPPASAQDRGLLGNAENPVSV